MAITKTDSETEAPVGSNPTRISDPLLRREARRAFVWVGIVGLAAVTVYMAQSLLVIFGGIVFAAMIDGGARLLERVLPIGRGWRVGIVMIGAVGFLGWLIWFAGSSIAAEAAALPDIIQEQFQHAIAWAHANGLQVEASSLQSFGGQLTSGVGTVTRALTGILGGITTALLIAVIGIYIAIEPRLYERGAEWMISVNRREEAKETLALMASRLRHLLGGRLLGMVIEGVFTYLMLMFYGVPLAALLGLITGVLAFIPNVGAIISGVLMVMVGFTGGADMGLYTIFVYFFVQTIDGWLLVPMIAKRTVDLAPALVLGWQLILGVLFGVLGLALADPMLAMIKVALERRAERQDEELKRETARPRARTRSPRRRAAKT
ncbi:MAG TPA: AI-2E family transporter [Croceibacterium sp.]|nr:AI-2E family transporter [Croceibacterium sp.]